MDIGSDEGRARGQRHLATVTAMKPPASRQVWNTADLARIGNAPEVWELTTFWNGPGGATMATLERSRVAGW